MALNIELDLIKKASQGDKKAINTIVEKYTNLIYYISNNFNVYVLDKDDLVQEGLLGLNAAINTFDHTKNIKFETYANTCIRNSIISAVNKFSRKKEIPQELIDSYDDGNYEELLTNESQEDDSQILYETYELINQKLSGLERDALLAFISGKTYEEISTELGKDEKAINNALQRARKKLNNK